MYESNVAIMVSGNAGGFALPSYKIYCTVPTAPLVSPAAVHRFDVSLKIEFLLRIILLTSPQARSDESALACAGL